MEPVVAVRNPVTNHYYHHPFFNNLPRPHAAYLFGGEDPLQQLARRQRFEAFRERRKQVLIGLSIVVASVLVNIIVINMFSVALTAPQFTYINSNETRINVYLWGEGTGSVYDELSPLPECMDGLYRSVRANVIGSNVLAVLALFFTAMSCSCATKPWRFTRPLLLLVSSIFGGFGTTLIVMQYGRGCDGESRWYRAGPGSFDLLVGTIFCLLLSLSTFAQVSRYPLRKLPSLQLLMGKYMDTEEDDERQHVGEEGGQIIQEEGDEEDDERQEEDEEMQV